MNNQYQPYAAGYDKEQETRAAANRIAIQSGRREAQARERSKEILNYYRNGQQKGVKK